MEAFSASSVGRRVAAAAIAVGIVLSAVPTHAETTPPVAVERQVAAHETSSTGGLDDSLTVLRTSLAARRDACSRTPERVAAMTEVAKEAMSTAVQAGVHPDPFHPSLSLPVDKGLDSMSDHFKEMVRDYVRNAQHCVRTADAKLADLDAPAKSLTREDATPTHGGAWNTRSMLGAGVLANHMRPR